MTRTAPPSMLIATLLCSLALFACGGGDELDAGSSARDAREQPLSSASSAADSASSATDSASAPQRKTTQALRTDPAGDPQQPSALVQGGVAMTHLGVASGRPDAGLRGVARTASCAQGFVAPADLTQTRAAPLPAAGSGIFYNATELATWRARISAGPFIADRDFAAGSPGDWTRIQAQAALFMKQGEPLGVLDESSRSRHGQLARDAAFVQLLQPNPNRLASVRRWLLEQAALPANDFANRLCYQYPDGVARDGYFAEAPWLARYIASYDFVRSGVPAAERVIIENYVRRNAWFFAAQLDWGLAELFPQRLVGSYRERGASAAATGDGIWWMRRVDGNADCRIDAADDQNAYPTYTHVRADGTLGPKVSVLAMWFNNRRAANALAAGSAGLLLADGELQHRAKRYAMEWLTWGAYADGSVSEYTRHGEYCVNRQGLAYGAMNVQSGVMLGRLYARQGDRGLVSFATAEGLFGSESGPGAPAKSLALVAQTLLRASTGELAWHRAEPQKSEQQPRAATALGNPREHYMNGSQAMDLMHELCLLSSAAVLSGVPVAATLLKHPLLLRSPPAGTRVETGLGSWTDSLAVLPAAYLLRP